MAKATNEHIGQMRERIAIERFTASQNATGEETGSWATLATVWTEVKYSAVGSDEDSSVKENGGSLQPLSRSLQHRLFKKTGFYTDLSTSTFEHPARWRQGLHHTGKQN